MRRSRPGAVVTEVVPRTGGRLSAVYEVRCSRPRDALIVKVYSEQWRWKQAKEAHVYRLLSGQEEIPVPALLHVEPDTGVIGSAFTVMTRLPGRPLSEVRTEADVAELGGVYRRMGAILAAIHRIAQESYGYLTTRVLDPEPDNSTYMTRQFARKLREFREHGGDAALHDAVETHVLDHAEVFARCVAPVLCHNDFHEGNVLVVRGAGGWRVIGFVDVENAVAADPLIDLAKTDYYALHGDTTRSSWLLDGYGRLPGGWRERMELYRLYHALELWDWFASVGEHEHLAGIADDMRRLVG